jgi:hypothetical protein
MAGGTAQLLGRRVECAVLGRLVEAVRAGESRASMVHGANLVWAGRRCWSTWPGERWTVVW